MEARVELERHNGVFVDRGCLFVSTTGKVLTGYANCEVVYPHFPVVWDLTQQLIAPFLGDVECFVCPSTGDIVLVQYATIIANQQGYTTTAAWADKQKDNSYRIERSGFVKPVKGKRVLVLNDRISQGGTTLKVIEEVRRCGGHVVGVSTLAGVSSLTADFLGVPKLHALCNVDVQAFWPHEVPEELRQLPIVVDESLGHGSEWPNSDDELKSNWPGGYKRLLAA